VRDVVRAAQSRDHGKKLVPATRPPQIVRLPWNSYTFSATYALSSTATKVEITVGNIRTQIRDRMGMGTSAVIGLKVNSAYAWNTSVGPAFAQPSMESLFWELTTDSGGSYKVRSEQYDHGTLNIPARGGYLYPLTDRKEVHGIQNDSHVIASFVTPAVVSKVTVRIMVLWNSSAPADMYTSPVNIPGEVSIQLASRVLRPYVRKYEPEDTENMIRDACREDEPECEPTLAMPSGQ
jgi:hypothetical protein